MRMNFTLSTALLLGLIPGWTGASAAAGDKITTLSSDVAGKEFTINTVRGSWYVAPSTTVVNACKGTLTAWPSGLSDADYTYPTVTTPSKFVLVKATNKDNYYLYCVDFNKWVVTNGNELALADAPVATDHFGIENATGSTSDGAYPTCVYFGKESEHKMYGISPQSRDVDVFKYYSTNDAGNSSALTENGTDYTISETLQSTVDAMFATTTSVVSAAPIAAAADFNGQAGMKYLIRNVSTDTGRSGYLHVDASGNITHQSTLPEPDFAEFSNYVFTTEQTTASNGSTIIVLKANNGGYIPKPTFSGGTNFGTTTTELSSAGKAAVEAKSGYPATTLNFLIDGNYMNVNPNNHVTIWNHQNDPNGVWQFIPVSNTTDNTDFTTVTTITRTITSQNGVTGTYGSYNTTVSSKYRTNQHILVPAVDFLSSAVSSVTGSTVTAEVSEQLPFEVSSGDNWYWYNVDLRNGSSPKWMSANASGSVILSTTFTDDDYSKWAFKGSTVDGIQLYNKGLGKTYTLKGADTPVMNTENTNNNFILYKNSDGFTLGTSRLPGRTNKRLNDVSGRLGYWNHASAPTDDGSTFRVFLPKGYYTMKNYQNASGSDTRYGYLGVSTDASTNTNLIGRDASASLANVVYIAPTSVSSSAADPRYVTMQVEGKSIQNVATSTQVTLGDEAKNFMVSRPNVGYFAFGYVASGTAPAQYAYLHCDGSKKIVGWEATAAAKATSWQVLPAGTYTLNANDGGDGNYYATFYAPFAVKLGDGVTARTLTLAEDKTSATLNRVTLVGDNNNILPANSPVIIISTNSTFTVTPVVSDATAITGNLALTGVSLATAWTDHSNDLVLGKADNGTLGFYKWDGSTLKNNRAYLSHTTLENASASSAKGITIDFGTVDAINNATVNTAKKDGKVYNLQGQQVGSSYKGLVIKNGRKVMQK